MDGILARVSALPTTLVVKLLGEREPPAGVPEGTVPLKRCVRCT
jgi:hypothetical protein